MIDDSPPLPKVHARTEDAERSLFKVERVELEFSNGARRTFERLISRGVGAVIVVAMPDPDTVLLVREYACGVHRYEIGLPKGRVEPGESHLDAANRELQEEAGFAARDLKTIGHLTLAPGYMTHVTQVVLARDLYESRLPGDEPEPLEVIRWPIANLVELIERDDCTEGRTIAALYMARDLKDRL
ncbi:MAG: ADP compounds hydrolase NudE [Wenzhouxiangellaceae bacterium]